jgi:hypothetical protein
MVIDIMKSMIIVVVICSGSVFADSSSKGKGQVSRIYPSGNSNNINFRLKGDVCKTEGANKYWYFSKDHPMADYWFSMLLSASSTGNTIIVGVSSGVDNCDPSKHQEIGYILVDY